MFKQNLTILEKGYERWIMKDELSGKLMKGFVGLRAKTYSYLKRNNDEDKKSYLTIQT